jgi:hypothetical protein
MEKPVSRHMSNQNGSANFGRAGIFPFVLILITLLVFGCKTQKAILPDLSPLHPTVQRMLLDRGKTMEELIATRFTPKGYKFDSIQSWEPDCMRVMYSHRPRESYDFYCSEIFLITLSLESYLLADSVDTYPLASVFEVFGEPEAILQSSYGHSAYEYIYPKYGIVFHDVDSYDCYRRVEIFKPTTLRNYKNVFYNDPHFFDPYMEKGKRVKHHRRYQRPY